MAGTNTSRHGNLPDFATADRGSGAWPGWLGGNRIAADEHDPEFLVGHRVPAGLRSRNDRRNDVHHRGGRITVRLHRGALCMAEPGLGDCIRRVEPVLRILSGLPYRICGWTFH